MNWFFSESASTHCAKDCFATMARTRPENWDTLKTDTTSGILLAKDVPPAQFAVLVSGGAANGPLFAGYCGSALADAVVAGGAFAAPNAYALYKAGTYLAGGNRGILLLYNNFAGDYLNNDLAQELLELDQIPVESVRATDDLASAVGEARSSRNGRCGIALLIRLAAVCRNMGMGLHETAALLRRTNERLNTLSVHLDCTTGTADFGAGFSGEPGLFTRAGLSREELAAQAMQQLLEDLAPVPGEQLLLLVNRLRLTAYPDGYAMAGAAETWLRRSYPVFRLCVGAYSNIADRYGWDFSLLRVPADQIPMWQQPVSGDGFVL